MTELGRENPDDKIIFFSTQAAQTLREMASPARSRVLARLYDLRQGRVSVREIHSVPSQNSSRVYRLLMADDYSIVFRPLTPRDAARQGQPDATGYFVVALVDRGQFHEALSLAEEVGFSVSD